MKFLILGLMLINSAFAVMDEDCKGSAKEAVQKITSGENFSLSFFQETYAQAVEDCRQNYRVLNQEEAFSKALKSDEAQCEETYKDFSYAGKHLEIVECKLGKLNILVGND